MKDQHLIVVKSLGSDNSMVVNSLAEAELQFIKIMKESGYKTKDIAKFFGIDPRAYFYKRKKLLESNIN